MRKFVGFFLLGILFQAQVKAQHLSSEAKISILSCNPGTDVYSMYGHSAIRVNDPENQLDLVFNYGVFSFDSPNFLYRFAKGQTDYLMISERYSSFIREYEKDRRSVYEQVLRLSPEGKDKLFSALIENAKPENRLYRYNFFTDNCATRVRDMIERNSGTAIRFTDNHPTESYRQLIKKYHHSFRWIDLGIDLLVGKKAEEPVTAYGQMFLPEYLMNQFAKAELISEGKSIPLVQETRTILEFPNTKFRSDLPWPAIVFASLFLFVLYISLRGYRRRRATDWLDYWIFALTGLSGFIIGWFTLYSEHPAVSPNFNLLWAFPPNLLFAGIWAIKRWRRKTKYYFWMAGLVLILSVFTGQQFNLAVYLIMLTIMTRIAVNLIAEKSGNSQNSIVK